MRDPCRELPDGLHSLRLTQRLLGADALCHFCLDALLKRVGQRAQGERRRGQDLANLVHFGQSGHFSRNERAAAPCRRMGETGKECDRPRDAAGKPSRRDQADQQHEGADAKDDDASLAQRSIHQRARHTDGNMPA